MKNKLAQKATASSVALTTAIMSAVDAYAEAPDAQVMATSNMFQPVADWFNSLGEQAKVLVPAIGTIVIVIIGIVLMLAGSNWSRTAKGLLGGLIAGIALVCYGPAIITSLMGS